LTNRLNTTPPQLVSKKSINPATDLGDNRFDESMLAAGDGIEKPYAAGVSMGGSLLSNDSTDGAHATELAAPGFLVVASADTESAPLQRLQIVRGWIDAEGTYEEVIDVSCASGESVTAETNRCHDNSAKVDISDCPINAETGSGQLSALWHDPEFRAKQAAFYYARVIEKPTCRRSIWVASRAVVAPLPDLYATI
jgi:hypothetical protein